MNSLYSPHLLVIYRKAYIHTFDPYSAPERSSTASISKRQRDGRCVRKQSEQSKSRSKKQDDKKKERESEKLNADTPIPCFVLSVMSVFRTKDGLLNVFMGKKKRSREKWG